MKALDASPLVKFWTKSHGIKIKYAENGKKRRYLPDLLVEYEDGQVFVEEIKGKVWDRLNFARKNLAALIWCRKHGYTFRTVFWEELDRVS